MFKLLYILFFVACILGGSKYIGGIISFRQLMSVYMLCYCLYNYKSLYRTISKYIILYIAFVLSWIFSSTLEGSIDKCFRTLIAQHLVSLIGYFATILLYRKQQSLDVLFKTILTVGILNSFVCLLQYIGNPIGIGIGLFFVDAGDESIIGQFEMLASGENKGGYLFGLFGNAVNNGYFSMILPLVPFYFFLKKNGTLIPVLLCSLFFLVVLFLIQQRSCFIFSVLMLVIILFKNRIISAKRLLYLIIFMSIPIIYFSIELLNSDVVQNSRLVSHTEESRSSIYSLALSFIGENMMFGGLEKFRGLAHFSPHNIFLNGFIYGGFFGGIIIFALYISQLIFSFSQLKFKKRSVVAAIFITLSLNALLHNNSILTGDVLVWIMWGAVFCISKDYNNYSKKNGIPSHIGNNTGLQCREVSAKVR